MVSGPGGDVLVTGMAWSTALGCDLDDVWRALLSGATGMTPVPSAHPLRNDRAAVLPDLPLDLGPVRRQFEAGSRTLRAAVSDAGLDLADPRLRLVVGTSYGSHLDVPPDGLDVWGDTLATELGLARRPLVVSTACSAGSDAISVGSALIGAGEEEICVVGGVDVLTPAKRLGHSALGTMSATELRAFDASHDGTILGEGAAFLVLEEGGSARARGARRHGRLAGVGSANDATGPTAPDPSGDTVVRAIHAALAAAGRDTTEVGVLNAHGSGTPVNDDVESRAFAAAFAGGAAAGGAAAGGAAAGGGAAGGGAPVVFATKGAFGHSLGATGALEAVAVLLALRDGQVPPVPGLRTVMPGFPLPLPSGAPLPFTGDVGLSVTIGFGGFTTCLALEAPA
ncbi:beta-ketoacyl synthase N-terminal-like domain-containing protein [Micromonospora sp. NPDC050397]|uniref:beta-ketoacyl synthase N-terminal-like domain-containing protein n=1 Tax=Micromonospora sp. NPDC050397 TaxID=3364279 RepID=UPI00384B7153